MQMNPHVFVTKADTLKFLEGKVSSCAVKPQVSFTIARWKAERGSILDAVEKELKDERLIVRSSAATEDSCLSSNAGRYVSVPHVPAGDRNALIDAVGRVIVSYGSGADADADKVIVQGEISSIAMIGVAFTCDPTSLAPYYIVNYRDRDASFDSVTAGRTSGLKTYMRFKRSPQKISDGCLERIIAAIREVEGLLNYNKLDVEFAIDGEGDLYILQVRPIVHAGKVQLIDEHMLEEYLLKSYKKIKKLNNPHPYLYGSRTILGVMPDWNPAEILGSKPRALAVSLYRELVTDAIWAYQRSNYGYKNVRSFPLLRVLMGLAYIDVRVSFNSFIPKGVSEELSHKLVNYYLAQLSRYPQHHDKVEFEIVFSCYYLNLAERIRVLRTYGFSDDEIRQIREHLLELTNNILHPKRGFYHQDLERVEILKQRQEAILSSQLPLIDKIYWLVEDCKRYGTLPFAGLARCAFIARQFMKSFVETGIISDDDLQAFMGSLDTVTKRFNADYAALRQGRMPRDKFLTHYGHLRPGTYDILSARYDEGFEQYFSLSGDDRTAYMQKKEDFVFTAEQMRKIDHVLKNDGLCVDARQLLDFIRQATVGREYAKFIFTKSVSEALVLLEQLGNQLGISREELSFLDIRRVLDLYAVLDNADLPKLLMYDIHRNRDAYKVTSAIKMPHLILNGDEVYDFFVGDSDPNFVTLKRVVGATIREENFSGSDVSGKIVFVPSADPGYDWLFSKGILCLVTMYGGANSHMAVRAAELDLPAIIGAGEQNYTSWAKAAALDIDCANKQVTVIV